MGPCGIRSLWRWFSGHQLHAVSGTDEEGRPAAGGAAEEKNEEGVPHTPECPASGCLSALFLTGETVDDTIYIMSELFPTAKGGVFGQEKVGAGECAAAGEKESQGRPAVVFSRFGLMALLLILELVLLWMMWRWFNNDFEWFAAVQGVFTVLMFFSSL